jgi:hypothetical protein
MAKPERYTLCVDFDGVLHRYDSKWVNAHTIPDPPVDGAIEWLHTMIQQYDVVIYSTRCASWRGRRAMKQWLKRYAGAIWYEALGCRGIEDVTIWRGRKPIGLIYLDDRAVRFTGTFPTVDELRRSRPWNFYHERTGY